MPQFIWNRSNSTRASGVAGSAELERQRTRRARASRALRGSPAGTRLAFPAEIPIVARDRLPVARPVASRPCACRRSVRAVVLRAQRVPDQVVIAPRGRSLPVGVQLSISSIASSMREKLRVGRRDRRLRRHRVLRPLDLPGEPERVVGVAEVECVVESVSRSSDSTSPSAASCPRRPTRRHRPCRRSSAPSRASAPRRSGCGTASHAGVGRRRRHRCRHRDEQSDRDGYMTRFQDILPRRCCRVILPHVSRRGGMC